MTLLRQLVAVLSLVGSAFAQGMPACEVDLGGGGIPIVAHPGDAPHAAARKRGGSVSAPDECRDILAWDSRRPASQRDLGGGIIPVTGVGSGTSVAPARGPNVDPGGGIPAAPGAHDSFAGTDLGGADTARRASNADLGAGLMVGPDFGGLVPMPPNHGVNANAALVALSPGLVLSTQGTGVAGALVMAKNAAGTIVGVCMSDGEGTFVLGTPADDPLFLDVVGTALQGIPFVPGSPIVIVLP